MHGAAPLLCFAERHGYKPMKRPTNYGFRHYDRRIKIMLLLFHRAHHGQRRYLGREEGQSLVEFAFTLPLLMLVLLGIVDFGTAFYDQILLTNAVTDAAQVLMAGAGNTPDPCQAANNAIAAAAPALNTSGNNLEFSVSANNASGTAVPLITNQLVAFPTSGALCSGDGGDLVQYQQVMVSATYGYTVTLLAFGQPGKGLISTYKQPINLTAKTSEAVQ